MADETPPTNDFVERLRTRLSPEARAVQAEIDALAGSVGDEAAMTPAIEARMDELLERADDLPDGDRELISQIAQFSARAHEARGAEYTEDAEILRRAAGVIGRAQEIQREAGGPVDEGMTVSEALAFLERHGEPVPGIDTGAVVEVPVEQTRTVPTFYPDFTNAEMWRRWDGSEMAETWARMLAARDSAIASSVGELAAAGVEGADYAGVIAALWSLDADEAERFVRLRQGGQL